MSSNDIKSKHSLIFEDNSSDSFPCSSIADRIVCCLAMIAINFFCSSRIDAICTSFNSPVILFLYLAINGTVAPSLNKFTTQEIPFSIRPVFLFIYSNSFIQVIYKTKIGVVLNYPLNTK